MPCGKGTLKWKRAMRIVKKRYPSYGIERRRRIAGSIVSRSKR